MNKKGLEKQLFGQQKPSISKILNTKQFKKNILYGFDPSQGFDPRFSLLDRCNIQKFQLDLIVNKNLHVDFGIHEVFNEKSKFTSLCLRKKTSHHFKPTPSSKQKRKKRVKTILVRTSCSIVSHCSRSHLCANAKRKNSAEQHKLQNSEISFKRLFPFFIAFCVTWNFEVKRDRECFQSSG